MDKVFVAATREERLKGQKIIVVLEKSFLQVVEGKNRTYNLATSTDHSKLLKANQSCLIEDARPDITHQCLLTLLDSPLNRSGRLLVYIRTVNNELIEVSPQLIVPRTWHQFEAMMLTFFQKRSLKAEKTSVFLLRFVKNNLEQLLPPGSVKIGLSVTGAPIRLERYCEQRFRDATDPIVIFIGAVAKSNPTTKEALPILEECVKLSDNHLTAAVCCGKVCGEFEYLWKVL